MLVQVNATTIEGHVGTAAGALAFTIQVDPATGIVTMTDDRSVKQGTATLGDTNEGISFASGLITLTATVTDKDGDTATATADVGSQITIHDDGPSITASGTAPALNVDESFLTVATNGIAGSGTGPAGTTVATGDFHNLFTAVTGADGGSTTYSLSITGGSGTASGLTDAQTNTSDVLVQVNATTIEGHVGTAAGALAFTIQVDPATGIVTMTDDRSVKQGTATLGDTNEGISFASGLITLTATVTDKDGDTATATADVGSQITIHDDGPSITASGTAPALNVDESFLTVATNGIAGSGTGPAGTTVATGDFHNLFTA